MIELVHINIHEKLASQIAKRQPNAVPVFGIKATDNFPKKAYYIFIVHSSPQNIFKNRMVNICKKFSDVALQNPNGSRVVFRDFACILSETVKRAMRSLAATAGV